MQWLALVAGVGGYVLVGVEIVLYISLFWRVLEWLAVVCLYARTHTQTSWVLDMSLGVTQTPGEPEESRLTKVQYTTYYVQTVYVYTVHLSTYILGCGF